MTDALIRSARLEYRGLRLSDQPALHRIVSDWAVVRQLGAFPWPARPEFTASRCVAFAGAGFVWGMILGGDLIGTVAVTKGELGYCLAPAHWRQGLAYEACGVALAAGFDGFPGDEILAHVWADNAGSLGLLAKLGFREIWRGLEYSKARAVETPSVTLALNRTDWCCVPRAMP